MATSMSAGSKAGIKLTSNIERLPVAPDTYVAPDTWTQPAKSFAVANKYQDCGGMCFAVTMARVKKAYLDSVGIDVISLSLRGQDYNISGTGTINRATIPTTYFGYGVGGALAVKGYAKLVPPEKVWNGDLQEGALVQYWWGDDPSTINKANNELKGHSIIFKAYTRDEASNITGFRYYDYLGTGRTMPKEGSERVFFGANLKDSKR
jgi:hypothetical protein